MFDLAKQAARCGIPPAVLKRRAAELYETGTEVRWLRLSQVFKLAQVCHTVPYLRITNSADGYLARVPSLIGTDLEGFYLHLVTEIDRLAAQTDDESKKATIEKCKQELTNAGENLTVGVLEKICKRLDVDNTLYVEIVFLTFHDFDLVKDPEASIPTQIRLFMDKYGYSQRTLAEELNMTQAKIKCWFNNLASKGFHAPSIEDLQKICALEQRLSGEPPLTFHVTIG